jgi:hypothetical protein
MLRGEKLELVPDSSTFFRAASPWQHSKPLNHFSITSSLKLKKVPQF